MHKKISYGGIGAALLIIFVWLAVYLPTGKASLVFASSLLVYIMCYELDKKTAFTMYLASSVLAFLLLLGASPVIVLAYIICFGNYPILKTFFDTKGLCLKILCKFVMYTLYFASVYAAIRLALNLTLPYALPVLYIGGIAVFGFYDWLLSQTGRYAYSLLHK